MLIKGEKFSYSKLSTFKECAYKYKLVYVDKHRVSIDAIATLFGSLVHYIEENIGNLIIENGVESLTDETYTHYKDMFFNINDKDHKLYGVNKLKEMFPDQFYEEDKNGLTYQNKVDYYVNEGIYRLRDYLTVNPHIKLLHTEHEFTFEYDDIILHGYIDRFYRDTKTNTYIVEDIKTYSADIESKKLKVPLQMVVYTLALKDKEPTCKVSCQYELPLIGSRQLVKNTKYLEMGEDTIRELLDGIIKEQFIPNPSPLCHWCPFCPTNKDQPEEAKNLCPYYMKWTRENKTFAVLNTWQGFDKDKILVESLQGHKDATPVDKKDIRIIRRR